MTRILYIGVVVGFLLAVAVAFSTANSTSIDEDCEEVMAFYERIETELGVEHNEIVTFMTIVLYAERSDPDRTFEDVERGLEKVLDACG